MIRSLYSLLMQVAQPLLRRKLLRRGAAEPGYLEAMEERFGRYAAPTEPGRLWIHAVSLGETRAAALLMAALRRRDAQLKFLLTHGTATGRAEGRHLLQPGDAQAWLPWDVASAVDAFLSHFQPRAGVLMETEIWPNLVAGCASRGIPLALANARLSDKSLRRTQRIGALMRPAYQALSAVYAQTQSDAQRLTEAGARVDGVFGNLKFDAQPQPSLLAQGRGWRSRVGRPVLMLASSREGEEAALLQTLQTLRAEQGAAAMTVAVHWLIVPRHPQRFDQVAAIATSAGFAVARRSAWPADGPPQGEALWIGDSMGEMALYYGLADAALLGGSFEPLGGQNLIEAAACGCPVLTGPHTFNFAEAAEQAEAGGAALRVATMEEGVRQAMALVNDKARHAQAVQAGAMFASAHRGAADRTAEALLARLPAPAPVATP